MNNINLIDTGFEFKAYDQMTRKLLNRSSKSISVINMLYLAKNAQNASLSRKRIEKHINELIQGLEVEWKYFSSAFENEYDFDAIYGQLDPYVKTFHTMSHGIVLYFKMLEVFDRYALYVSAVLSSKQNQYMSTRFTEEGINIDKGIDENALEEYKLKYFKSIMNLNNQINSERTTLK